MFGRTKRFYYVVDFDLDKGSGYRVMEKLLDEDDAERLAYEKFLEFVAGNNPYGMKAVILLPLVEQKGHMEVEMVKKGRKELGSRALENFWDIDTLTLEAYEKSIMINDLIFMYEEEDVDYRELPQALREALESDVSLDKALINQLKKEGGQVRIVIYKRISEDNKIDKTALRIFIPWKKITPTKFIQFLSRFAHDRHLVEEAIRSLGDVSYSLQQGDSGDYFNLSLKSTGAKVLDVEFDNRYGQAKLSVKIYLSVRKDAMKTLVQILANSRQNEFWSMLLPESVETVIKYLESPYDFYEKEKYLITNQSKEYLGKVPDKSGFNEPIRVPLECADDLLWAVQVYSLYRIPVVSVDITKFGCLVNKGQLTLDRERNLLIIIDPGHVLSQEVVTLLTEGYRQLGYSVKVIAK